MAESLDDILNDELSGIIDQPLSPGFLEILSELNPSTEESYQNESPFSQLTNSNGDITTDYSIPSISNFSIGSSLESSVPSPTTSPDPNRLEIIAQPCIQGKLRTLKDNEKEKRRNTLKTKTKNPNFTFPAVRVPKRFLDDTSTQYYVGVSLVTVFHDKSNCRYIHPYELKDINTTGYNDRLNNTVWYPIASHDLHGILCFPALRIDKKLENEVKTSGALAPFFLNEIQNSSNSCNYDLASGRQIIQEYNLKRMQLAFTLATTTNIDQNFRTNIIQESIIYSDEMVEGNEKDTTEVDQYSPPMARPVSEPPDCRMYRYAPRYGPTQGDQELLIFYTKKIERKYGDLKIVFQCVIPGVDWQAEVPDTNIEVKSQMVCLKTPMFPYSITEPIPVKINLQQAERILEPLQYFYIPTSQCLKCLENMTKSLPRVIHGSSNKRTKSSIFGNDDETDAMVPSCDNKPEFQQSKSAPQLTSTVPSSTSASKSSINDSTTTNDPTDQLMQNISKGVQALFNDNDYKPILRLFRSLVQPEFIHTAISKNHCGLLLKFIPVAKLDLLQKKNELGENSLLHAIRLNHINIIEALLGKEKSESLLEDDNYKKQNIFHIIANNSNSETICNLIIDHLLKKSINIREKFDYVDENNRTPLELAIINNNHFVTQQFLKYFNKNLCETSDYSGDNLIHLAVRHGDLKMLKLLLDDKELIEQGKQSNLMMTPLELARSLKQNNMVEYLIEFYGPPECDESSDSETD